MRREPLFWIVREHDGTRTVFLQQASEKLYAWLRAALAGHAGAPIEIFELDSATAKAVPKSAVGRVLEPREAAGLLDVIQKRKKSPVRRREPTTRG
jgi:hypothetical protein